MRRRHNGCDFLKLGRQTSVTNAGSISSNDAEALLRETMEDDQRMREKDRPHWKTNGIERSASRSMRSARRN